MVNDISSYSMESPFTSFNRHKQGALSKKHAYVFAVYIITLYWNGVGNCITSSSTAIIFLPEDNVCWWSGGTRSQGIINHVIDLILAK